MKFKFKIDENTSLDDVQKELDSLKKASTPEIPLGPLRKIIEYLGGNEVAATGSSVRFKHEALKGHPYFRAGIFQVHKIHKGGNLELIRKSDYKKYLYNPLIYIIATKKEQKNEQ
jgi:hypothetical protein